MGNRIRAAALAAAMGLAFAGCTPQSPPADAPPAEIAYSFVTETKYAAAGDFSEGLCAVSTGDESGPWGYINTAGEPEIPAYWDVAGPFEQGRACVAMAGRYGMVDMTGHVVIEPSSESPLTVGDGLVMCLLDGGWGCLDIDGLPMVPFIYEEALPFVGGLAPVRKDGLWGAIDASGGYVVDAAWEGTRVLSDGSVALFDGLSWGLASSKGVTAFYPKFEWIESLGKGLYAYRVTEEQSEAERKGALWGIADSAGKALTEAVYDEIIPCDGEFLRLAKGGGGEFVDYELKELDIRTPEGCKLSGGFVGGYAACESREGLWGVTDIKGQLVIEPACSTPATDGELEAYALTGLLRCGDGFAGVIEGLEGASLPYVEDGRTYAMIKTGGLWGLAELSLEEGDA